MSNPKWTRLERTEDVAQAACDQILSQAETAIAHRNRFRIVLAGGGTPQAAYQLLSKNKSEWKKWEVYFGDERCLPRGHPDLNSSMARQSLLSLVSFNPENIHPINTYLGAEVAAEQYIACIESATPFDLVLLGMGEDGHTASVFPGHEWHSRPSVYAVHNAPKPPADRVTLSLDTLGNSRKLLYLVTGQGKAEMVARWSLGETLPISSIPTRADSEVLIDAPAASCIDL